MSNSRGFWFRYGDEEEELLDAYYNVYWQRGKCPSDNKWSNRYSHTSQTSHGFYSWPDLVDSWEINKVYPYTDRYWIIKDKYSITTASDANSWVPCIIPLYSPIFDTTLRSWDGSSYSYVNLAYNTSTNKIDIRRGTDPTATVERTISPSEFPFGQWPARVIIEMQGKGGYGGNAGQDGDGGGGGSGAYIAFVFNLNHFIGNTRSGTSRRLELDLANAFVETQFKYYYSGSTNPDITITAGGGGHGKSGDDTSDGGARGLISMSYANSASVSTLWNNISTAVFWTLPYMWNGFYQANNNVPSSSNYYGGIPGYAGGNGARVFGRTGTAGGDMLAAKILCSRSSKIRTSSDGSYYQNYPQHSGGTAGDGQSGGGAASLFSNGGNGGTGTHTGGYDAASYGAGGGGGRWTMGTLVAGGQMGVGFIKIWY